MRDTTVLLFHYMHIMEKDPCREVVYLTLSCDHLYLVSLLLLFCYPYILLRFLLLVYVIPRDSVLPGFPLASDKRWGEKARERG